MATKIMMAIMLIMEALQHILNQYHIDGPQSYLKNFDNAF